MKFYVGLLGHLIITIIMFMVIGACLILGIAFNPQIIFPGIIGLVLIWFLYGIYLNGSKRYRAQKNQLTVALNKGFVKEEKLNLEKDEQILFELEPIMTTPGAILANESAFVRPLTITNKKIVIKQYKITLDAISGPTINGFGIRSDSYPYYRKFGFNTFEDQGKITQITKTHDEELGEGFEILVSDGNRETKYNIYTKESEQIVDKIKKLKK